MKDFSLWCDFIERGFLHNEFKTLLQQNIIKGATSNPSIFANAITHSSAYKSDIARLKPTHSTKQIYENLAFEDIKTAANALLPLWKKNKNDGYISIEIDPNYCHDAPKSIDEGRRIYAHIDMPNVMIKVPATEAGFEVMNALYNDGININATLVFSLSQTRSILEALKEPKDNRAVISVFVSRFDKVVPPENPTAPLCGIYNAMRCYHAIEESKKPHIRTLFASTSAKDKALDSSYYVRELMFSNTINTAPLETIEASLRDPQIRGILHDENPASKLPVPKETLNGYFAAINIDEVAERLLQNGLEAFIESFENMLGTI